MKNLWISLKITLAMCIVLGVGYVLVLRGFFYLLSWENIKNGKNSIILSVWLVYKQKSNW